MTDVRSIARSGEGETVELKERWNESALETLAAFANTRGGTLLVGVDDGGQVVGWHGKENDFRAISSQIVDALRIQPSVSLEPHEQKQVLAIRVSPSVTPVACRGRYYRRVGNTTREIPPEEMGRFFVAKLGIRWDSITEDWGLDEIDPESVRRFVRMARRRLPQATEEEPVESVLRKLDLIQDGRLTRRHLAFREEPPAAVPHSRNPHGALQGARHHRGRQAPQGQPLRAA